MSVTSRFLKISRYKCSVCDVRLINSDILCITFVLYFLLGQLYALLSMFQEQNMLLQR